MQLEEEWQEEDAEVIEYQTLHAEDIISLTARLAQVLAQEADYLEQMQVEKIAPLQEEKVLLTNALALIRKQLPEDGSFLASLDADEAARLREVITVFQAICEENYNRLNMARMVNQRIVEAVTEVVRDKTHPEAYDGKGNAGHGAQEGTALSLDKRI
jgi:hypothetical protein